MNISLLINSIYIISALLFIVGLKMMTSPSTARTGNMISASGMLIAILITLLDQGIIDPRDTREVISFALKTCSEAKKRKLKPNSFGVARM